MRRKQVIDLVAIWRENIPAEGIASPKALRSVIVIKQQ